MGVEGIIESDELDKEIDKASEESMRGEPAAEEGQAQPLDAAIVEVPESSSVDPTAVETDVGEATAIELELDKSTEPANTEIPVVENP